jgi:hypothetical protein
MNTVQFNIFDRPRKLKFDINAIADIEREARTGIANLLTEDRIGFDMVRTLLWGGLKWEDSKLTIRGVGDMIQEYIGANQSDMGSAMGSLTKYITEGLEASGLMNFSKPEDEVGESEAGAGK